MWLLPLLLCAGASAVASLTPLELVQGTRTTRRILVRDEVREYAELRLRFAAPVYALACEQKDAVYIAAAGQCARCPSDCVLTSLLMREPPVPGLLPEDEAQPECICGLSFEEVLLRAQSLPGVMGVGGFPRIPAELSNRTTVQAYGTAIWQHASLMGHLQCASSAPWTAVQRYGLNGPPLEESLWWLRRFETSFGLESVEALLANASANYQANLVVLLLPVSRTQNGQRIKIGPNIDELQGCTLELPLLEGPQGQPVASPQLGTVGAPTEPCSLAALAATRRQIEAILEQVPRATTQTLRCKEDWTTSWVPGGRRRSGGQFGRWSMAGSFSEVGKESWRAKRVGSLAVRSDFSAALASTYCATYRDQMKLVAHNLRERSLSYSASDAVTGCWALMERLISFEDRQVWKMTDTCTYQPSEEGFWSDACCNQQLTRTQCCMVRNTTTEERVPTGANYPLLAKTCRQDPSGYGGHLKSAVAAALSWQRRLSGSAGPQSCWRALMLSEMANIDVWRTVQRCHDDVMGRYDRELRMYAGAPCLVDADCFTECQKPVLRSLQTFDRGAKGQLLGRCRVPTSSRHVYLIKCMQQRVTGEVWDTILQEIYKETGTLATSWTDASRALFNVKQNRVTQCLGPFSSNGVAISEAECLSKRICNWNHQLSSETECTREMLDNMDWCGCAEGWCFQQSFTAGCVKATNMEPCYEARAVLHDAERRCIARAVTPVAMARCDRLAQLHEGMLEVCLRSSCYAEAGGLALHDQRCLDSFSPTIAYCLRDCNMPSGPFPSNSVDVCYAELLPNETEVDCHALPGDTLVHYVSSEEGGDVSIEMMEHLRPKYCSVRQFYHMRDIEPVRSQDKERLELEARDALDQVTLKLASEQSEKADYLAKLASLRASLEGETVGCGMNILEMGVDDLRLCRDREAEGGCCLSPLNTTHALCELCALTNTTVCRAGDDVYARHPLGQHLFRATIESDRGDDYVVVAWAHGSTLHREVPWPWTFINRSGVNTSCVAESEGCTVHAQCRQGEYCVSCDQCLEEMGLAAACLPCPSRTGNVCKDYALCEPRQDSVDGECPADNAPPTCPCKDVWSVRNQYDGALSEIQISGCFFDVAAGYRWCELDTEAPEFQVGACGESMITGVDRYIYWAQCEPDCSECHCDCTPNCRAYDIVPYQGKLPGQGVIGQLGVSPPASEAKDAGYVGSNCSDGALQRKRGRCALCVACCADYCHEQAALATLAAEPPTPSPPPDGANATDDFLACACGSFVEGGAVRRNSSDGTDGGPSVGATGIIVAGSAALGILVDWDDWSGGHAGLCQMADCGTCILSGTSRWWMACADIEAVASRRLTAEPASGTAVFDCIATNSTGCGDSPRGWRDSVGRTCRDYARLQLCMPNGGVGPGWHYVNPTRTFKDFWNNWLSADEVCCDCGGGAACSNTPQHWVDEDGFDCDHYEAQEWCNRSGFGPGWDPSRGVFRPGSLGMDARSACCSCGGGNMLVQRDESLVLVDDASTCSTIWPRRAKYGVPPWYSSNTEICPDLNGVCMRKVSASVIVEGGSSADPDHDRIWGLCEQFAFQTGLQAVLEDSEILDDLRLRRLGTLNEGADHVLTDLSRNIQQLGSGLQLNFFANFRKGMCYYRLPDPFGVFGGPRRDDLSELWLPPWPENETRPDPYQAPKLTYLGWPFEFWSALPPDPYPETMDSATMELERRNFNDPPLVLDAQNISSDLNSTLERFGISMVSPLEYTNREAAWTASYDGTTCTSLPDDEEMLKYQLNKKWQPQVLGSDSLCHASRCDFDETVTSGTECRILEGCTANCHYCASQALSTKEQGVCYATLDADVVRCDSLGGVLVEGKIFDHLSGVSAQRKVCALPHRPLTFCTAPGEQVRYCAQFDRPHCETDPLAAMLGCSLKVRQCKTQAECSVAGRCSDEDLGLNWAATGTCIVSPIVDQMVQTGCDDKPGAEFCFFRLDPPVGMEVRWRHGVLDLLGDAPSNETEAWRAPPGYDAPERLRSFGRLTMEECNGLEDKMEHAVKGLWVERATDVKTCKRWRGCCLVMLGGRCTLYTGSILDASAQDEAEASSKCTDCGGHWVPVFEWEIGTWRTGQLVDHGRQWYPRAWDVANDWAETVDLDALRQTLENSMEDRLGQDRLNCVRCLLEPLFAAITGVATACGDDDPTVRATVEDSLDSATRFPLGAIEIAGSLGSAATFGSLGLSWHAGSFAAGGAGAAGRVSLELSVEPLELSLGAAAPQIALPGRAETLRERLEKYVHVPDSTIDEKVYVPSQNPMTNEEGGYPSWVVDMMVAAYNPELTAEEVANSDAAAALAQQLEQEKIDRKARLADSRSGLPEASAAVLTESPAPAADASEGEFDLASGPCRSVVASAQGEVVGEVLGDCVRLSSSAQLDASVELCVPVSHTASALEKTPQAEATGGVVFDFARQEIVPSSYGLVSPSALTPATAYVPGDLGARAWQWRSSANWGRLPSGWRKLTALHQEAELRHGGLGGTRLCARVFQAGWTYCPIVRLNTSVFFELPEAVAVDLGPVDSGCRSLDQLLRNASEQQPDGQAYVPLDMQVSGSSANASSATPVPPPAACPAGSCMAFSGRGFVALAAGSPGCAITC